MANNKIILGNETLMDLTEDTVDESKVLLGETFHDKSGNQRSGTLDPYVPTDSAETVIADDDYFPFYDTSASGKRKTLWSNIKAKLKTYFDTIYSTFSGSYNDLTNKPTAGTGIAINNNVIAVDADNTPTENSEKPVKSKGVYSALESSREESTSLLKSTVGWTGKNLLNDDIYFYESGISVNKSGHTFTIETTTVATRYASLMFRPSNNTMYPAGQYKLSLDVSTIGDATARVAIRRSNNSIISAKILSVGANLLEIDTSEDFYISVFPRFEKTDAVTLVFSNPMLRDASITDDTYEPYHESVEEVVEQIYADNGVLGAKNLLKYPYIDTTITKNGITFTDNGDGSVTVNGTATASADFHCGTYNTPYYYDFVNRYKGTDRKFRFASKTSNVRLQFWSTNFTVYNEDVFAFPANINMNNFNFSIHVDNGVTVNNETIYPMMILASDPDDTYVPYAMTNRELTEEKLSISELKTIASSAADFAAFKTAIANL